MVESSVLNLSSRCVRVRERTRTQVPREQVPPIGLLADGSTVRS
jgi:hypothetical protein